MGPMKRISSKTDALTRRDFLAASTFSVASAAALFATEHAEEGKASRPWYETMRRCGQINVN